MTRTLNSLSIFGSRLFGRGFDHRQGPLERPQIEFDVHVKVGVITRSHVRYRTSFMLRLARAATLRAFSN